MYTYDDSKVHVLGPDVQRYYSYGRVAGKTYSWGKTYGCVHYYAFARIQAWADDAVPPDFETDWFEMQSGTGCSSAFRDRNVQEVAHGLGQRPEYVEVWVRVPESTPTYGGLMFKATGAANGHSYSSGGTLTAWSSSVVRVWMSCQYRRGIYLTGFGGERLQLQDSITRVDVKVRAWIDFPGGTGSGVSGVSVNVNDANRPPVLPDLVVDVPETAESGTDLGQLMATDPDGTS